MSVLEDALLQVRSAVLFVPADTTAEQQEFVRKEAELWLPRARIRVLPVDDPTEPRDHIETREQQIGALELERCTPPPAHYRNLQYDAAEQIARRRAEVEAELDGKTDDD